MKRYNIGLWSENNTIGCFDTVKRKSNYVNANIIAEHSLMGVDNRISIGVNNLEFADIKFILFSVGCCWSNAHPIPVFDASVSI